MNTRGKIRYIAIGAVLTVLISQLIIAAFAAMGVSAFASDTPSSWAAEQVSAAIAENLVPQNLRSSYTQATTRAEFAGLAVALYENVIGDITGRVSFHDTNDVSVQKAAYIGVVNGVGDNSFAPNDMLTREQAATMLASGWCRRQSPAAASGKLQR